MVFQHLEQKGSASGSNNGLAIGGQGQRGYSLEQNNKFGNQSGVAVGQNGKHGNITMSKQQSE